MYHNRNFIASLNYVSLIHGSSSLGLFNFNNMINYKKGDLINGIQFVRRTKSNDKNSKAIFICRCGNEFNMYINKIKSGHTKSCGCYTSKLLSIASTVHGDGTKSNPHYLYRLWCGIKERCYNKKGRAYFYYGKRGITMNKLWVSDYLDFKKWILDNLGERPTKKHSLDRINNDGNYEPNNLRWATHTQQINNRRKIKLSKMDVLNIKRLLLKGELKQKEIAHIFGVSKPYISIIHTGGYYGNIVL